jgi:hypothetical protein
MDRIVEVTRKNKEVRPMEQRIIWIAALLWVLLQPAGTAWAQDDSVGGWPREIDTPRAKVVIYQPQPEKLQGNRLDARAAVAIEFKDKSEPVFGAVWFQARLDTDREERTATIADISVTQVRFPEQDQKKAEQLRTLLEREIPKWYLPISMDRLLATLELAEERSEAAEKINTKPPKILFVSEPAILISVDGEPRLKQD